MIEDEIEKVVVWGHKLHSNTFSYIHYAFVKAFKHLGYDTYWLDNKDDLKKFDFSRSLFITEGQVDQKIPAREDCYYVLHNCDLEKYQRVPKSHKLILQVYTHDAVNKWKAKKVPGKKFHFFGTDTLYMPWATDLLPDEIDEQIENLDDLRSKNEVNFVGTWAKSWAECKIVCSRLGIKFVKWSGFFTKNVSFEKNMELVQSSIVAPALQSDWQVENGYIPCRIFKNISYGKMGLTNNPTVHELFDGKVIYDPDVSKLIEKGLGFESTNDKRIVKELMEEVRDNHTYLNRIECIFWMFNNVLE